MPPKKNVRNVMRDLTESAQYLFYADRLSTFKNFAFDKIEGAVCTSEAVARAGFHCTGTESAKCPFCLKELEFEAEDDPWAEHSNRKPDCDFVKLDKRDDKTWTVEDLIRMAVRHNTMAKLDQQLEKVRDLREKLTGDGLAETLTKLKIGEQDSQVEKKPSTRISRKK